MSLDLDIHHDRIIAGDADAFARWLASAEPALRATLRSFAQQVDTEAILQEGLLRVWQYAGRVERDGGGNSLLRYGARVCQNLAIDEARRNQRAATEPIELSPEPVAPRVRPPDPKLMKHLEECLGKLPSRPSSAIKARLQCGATVDDHHLAASCEMKLNTFLKNVGRARQLLVRCLEGHGVKLSEELA